MQVAEGYKQTEVGVIPEDWEINHLGELSKISAGGTPSRSIQDYWSGDIPWITTTEINGGYIRQASQFITKNGLDNSATKYLPIGTLLLALYGQGKTRGKVGILSINATTNQACAAIQVDRKNSNQYIFYFLSHQYLTIRELSNSGSQDNLNSSIVKAIPIPLPPTKAEQEAIAEALSDADSLIESLQQLIAKKRLIKQGAMQTLLHPKPDWVEKTLGDISKKIIGGGTPSRMNSDYWGGNIPWMTVKDFAKFSPNSTIEYISNLGLQNSASNLVPKGTLITSTRMALGKSVVFNVDVSINQDLKAIYPTSEVQTPFLHCWFQVNETLLSELGSGSTVMGISLSDLRKIPFHIPPLKEQTRIATILNDMDEEITALETKLSKAQQIKQGMMSELLTGKIRLV